MWALMVVLLAASVQALQQIHHVMTKEELRNTFHVESHDHVPEYEVVRVKRSHEDVKLKAFGKTLRLKLRQSESPITRRTPVFEASTNSSGELHYTKLPQDEHVGDTYQDLENQAAMLFHKDPHGNVLMEGTIGQHLVVRPVPFTLRQRLRTNISQDDDYLNEIPDSGTSQTGVPSYYHINTDHIVYKRNDPLEHLSDFAFMEPDEMPKKRRVRRHISKREAPYVIYPEILVIVDYDGYRLHGGDNVQIKRYFISFWNGVDLRYKLLKGPRVRISIAGIIISRGRDATPYLERNRVGRDAIDSAAALTDMGKYLFRERRLPVYDIAVAITKYDMCRRRKAGRCTKGTAGMSKLDMCRRTYPNESCNRGTAGFAYVGGACVVNKRLEKVNSVAIIEDTGGFSGIIVAAHEVGHLLGAVHDGSPPPSYLGGPGAEKCRWEDGYIMSDLRHTEKGFRWSPCSIASFHHFLNGETATCLFNSPHEDESLPRVLPGRLLSLDAQCRRDRGTSACFKDERVCAQLFCFDAGSGYCVAYRPAAEGSPCGDSQYCSNGRCIQEHENIIPDYSQHTPTYVRRSDTTLPLDNSNKTTTSFWQNFWTSSTTTERYSPATSTLPKYSFTGDYTPTRSSNSDETHNCVDNKMPGGVTCYDFVTRFGQLYCNTVYITKTCCASHRSVCKKSPIK